MATKNVKAAKATVAKKDVKKRVRKPRTEEQKQRRRERDAARRAAEIKYGKQTVGLEAFGRAVGIAALKLLRANGVKC